ncbi:hypothetical protein H6F76_18030 [Leptolyngbya sp. FACHB-321]|uniref:hypothetical protein n=1 Tax=Leptolyngbya sp. FACHB-321 TaxID=2692807 RepID=UPI001684E33A|nr:hypothetical protein [Leptolyngbya sp. FACHB-321]MBD2036909.1 hypothetical protein [Leptolyngbya sp. FACHB-321]
MNTLAKIQGLTAAEAPVGQDWEPYFTMFEALPTLAEADLIHRTWIMEPSVHDTLVGGNETPLYTISSERRTIIRTLCQNRSFINQAIAQWLRYYQYNLVEYRPQEETPEYVAEAEALYIKARFVLCEGLYKHVEWFRINFREPRIVWLSWLYLDLLACFEELCSNRYASPSGKPLSMGKAKLFEHLRKAAKEEENLENAQAATDYSHLEAFLKSDPVTSFAAFKSLTELEALIETMPKACTATARLSPDFEFHYWIPFTKARSRYHCTLRKDKRYQMTRM